MKGRARFYFSYWQSCAAEAWRGSVSMANTWGPILGGVIVAVVSFFFRLTTEAPSSIEGNISFTVALALLSAAALWIVIYLIRLLGAPARLMETTQGRLDSMAAKVNEYATKLTPRFRVSFNRDAEGLARTPILVTYNIAGALVTNEYDGTYVRVRVEALSDVTVPECSAFLTKLQRENVAGEILYDIPLPHSVLLNGGELFDVRPNIVTAVDFLMCSSQNNKMTVPGSDWPLALRGIFDQTGTYHFTITVNGGGVSDSVTVSVGWGGRWDRIIAHQVGH
jgi:hypothetical protein